MNIETERLIIRKLNLNDLYPLYKVLSNKEVMKYIEEPFTIEKTEKFIKNVGVLKKPLVYAIEFKDTNEVIGHVIYHEYDKNSYEIGWIINNSYWGLGIANEITQRFIEYSNIIGIKELVIECNSKQTISKHIALKNKFIYEETIGDCDVYRLFI